MRLDDDVEWSARRRRRRVQPLSALMPEVGRAWDLLTPDLRRDAILTPAGEPYMERFFVVETPGLSVRFHHLLASDPDRDLHDHPWDFVSLLLEGSYTERTPKGEHKFFAGDLLVRHAESAHQLRLDAPVWTYVVTGPVRRRWGFHTDDGWVHWSAYRAAGSSSREW